MSIPEIARGLGMPTSQAENAYKDAVRRLRERLQDLVRRHVERYCGEGDADDEFRAEWGRLQDYLSRQGGLEQAVRAAYEGLDPLYLPERKASSMQTTMLRLTDQLRRGQQQAEGA